MLDVANKTEITVIGKYVNNDTGLTLNVSNRNVNEISNHHYFWKVSDAFYMPYSITHSVNCFSVLHFAQDKLPHELKNEPDKGLTVEFILFLVCLFWGGGENVVDSFHKLVYFACTEVTDKV